MWTGRAADKRNADGRNKTFCVHKARKHRAILHESTTSIGERLHDLSKRERESAVQLRD